MSDRPEEMDAFRERERVRRDRQEQEWFVEKLNRFFGPRDPPDEEERQVAG
jgi:hypothetical protein